MRLMLTGASGFVAGSIIQQAPTDWEIHAVSRSAAPMDRPGLVWHSLDPLETERLRATFREVRPEAIIHAAAMADIDACEANPALAREVNVELSRHLADLCLEGGCRMVYVSTDNVFDGTHGNYDEDDVALPINLYAETKVEAEKLVLKELRGAIVARTAIVMGLPVIGMGNSFVSRLVRMWERGEPTGVPEEEIRTPIDVHTLGRALLELASNDITGIIHLAGNDTVNRLVMSRRIAECLGYSPHLVVANDPSGIPGRAPRPRNVSLNNTKARLSLKTPMKSLTAALDLIAQAKAGRL